MPSSHASTPLLFLDSTLIDPESDRPLKGGMLVQNGKIADFGPELNRTNAPSFARMIECEGQVLAPGIIDMRAFVGEPGAEYRETLASATKAAAWGGITTLVATPDTRPPLDQPILIDFFLRRAQTEGCVRVLPTAAVTKNFEGKQITEIGLLQAAGAVAFTDGYHSIGSARIMRRALTYARDFDALLLHHAEDKELADGGVMNEGGLATQLGLPAIPREAETIILDRDLRLVNLVKGRYHALFVTNHLSLEVIRRAKEAGLPVTCGISINHLCLNEQDIGEYRTFLKFSPPLRQEQERVTLVRGVVEGIIDVIMSDHNPQDVETKRLPFAEAQNGAVGLETLLSAGLLLVDAGYMTLPQLFKAISLRPAEILRLPQGRLQKGAPADLILFDPHESYIVNTSELHSRCRNTPFEGKRLKGRVAMTLVQGKIVYERSR